MHQNIIVFVEDGDWYIQFNTKCKNLASDNRCGIYDVRPAICREYEPGDCDYAAGSYSYDNLFTHPSQIEDYYERKKGQKLPPPGEILEPSRRKRSARRRKSA